MTVEFLIYTEALHFRTSIGNAKVPVQTSTVVFVDLRTVQVSSMGYLRGIFWRRYSYLAILLLLAYCNLLNARNIYERIQLYLGQDKRNISEPIDFALYSANLNADSKFISWHPDVSAIELVDVSSDNSLAQIVSKFPYVGILDIYFPGIFILLELTSQQDQMYDTAGVVDFLAAYLTSEHPCLFPGSNEKSLM